MSSQQTKILELEKNYSALAEAIEGSLSDSDADRWTNLADALDKFAESVTALTKISRALSFSVIETSMEGLTQDRELNLGYDYAAKGT